MTRGINRLIMVAGVLVIALAVIMTATGCGSAEDRIPRKPGVVSQNLIENEGTGSDQENVTQICVRLDAEPDMQYCAEEVEDNVSANCTEGQRWPDCATVGFKKATPTPTAVGPQVDD